MAIALVSALALSGCIKETANYASDEIVWDVAYLHDGPPRVYLYTTGNNESGAAAHSALVINASQRMIFDPAGTIKHDVFIEQDDVLYGVTPSVLEFYTRAHARKTHHVVIQDLDVSPEIAERALQLVRANGPVTSAFCASATSANLHKSLDLKELVRPCSQINWPQISQKSGACVNKNYMNTTMPTNASR